METITLSFEPGSDFAIALEKLIRDSKGVRVVKRNKKKETTKRTALDIAIQEENEGKVHSYSSVDEFFEKMGIECSK